MEFTWDPDRAAENLRKHGVDFVEASTIVGDPLEVTIPDPEYSEGEGRFLSLGQSTDARLLVVAYTEREGTIRIIHRAGTNVVLLDADVAKAFPDSASVNAALRLLLEIAEKQLHAKRPA